MEVGWTAAKIKMIPRQQAMEWTQTASSSACRAMMQDVAMRGSAAMTRSPAAMGRELTSMVDDVSNDVLALIASYLQPNSVVMFAAAIMAPSASWARRSMRWQRVKWTDKCEAIMSSAGGETWTTLDISDMGAGPDRTADRLSDDDMAAILGVIDARRNLTCLKLVPCRSLNGHGLECLRDSTKLKMIALDAQRHDEKPEGALLKPGLAAVIRSILSTEGNVLSCLQVQATYFREIFLDMRMPRGTQLVRSEDTGCLYFGLERGEVLARMTAGTADELEKCLWCGCVSLLRECEDCLDTIRCTCVEVVERQNAHKCVLVCEDCGVMSCENCKCYAAAHVISCEPGYQNGRGHVLCKRCRLDRCRRGDLADCDRCRSISLDEMFRVHDHKLVMMSQTIRAYERKLDLVRTAATEGDEAGRLGMVMAVVDFQDDDVVFDENMREI